MLDIMKNQCDNIVEIEGVLKELDIERKTTNDGRDYISGTAIIGVEQEVKGRGTVTEEIPVRMFSMRLKKDGTENGIYSSIARMSEELVSMAAADRPEMADTVSITSGRLEENVWIDQSTGMPRSNWQISTSFMRKKKKDFTDANSQKAKFEMTCVIGNDIADELDKNGEPTGRLLMKAIVVGWQGKTDILDIFIESEQAKAHVQQYWNKGDTVRIAGYIVVTQKTTTYEEQMGFGENIVRTRTQKCQELILSSGSTSALEEDISYSPEDIKKGLEMRANRIEEMKNKQEAKKTVNKASMSDFGF